MKKTLLAMAVVSLVGAVLAPAPALAGPDSEITTATMNKTSVAVAGLNTVPVTITVTGDFPGAWVLATLKRTSGSVLKTNYLYAELAKVSEGTWKGNINVPSTADGTFKVLGFEAGNFAGIRENPGSEPTPPPTPMTLAVQGSHQPKITSTTNPKVAPEGTPYTTTWRVLDEQTGKPYGTRLTVGLGTGEVGCGWKGTATKTDTNGALVVKYRGSEETTCLNIPGDPTSLYAMPSAPLRPRSVSATPAKASAPVGTFVNVNGSATIASGCAVWLQRLYGATQWRNVNSATVRASGRFTLIATPAYKGKIPYRALVPECGWGAAATSKPFTITGL
ncbi:hypothetical protein E1263_23320 [Kribbella antibiotica]|uniref:Uncharacterized protein n=1 Tax=Kribbella antibiotica TaxID=190195 RepID=A0A4R4ZIH4_9ACTN|nr:hypothetical protein [Kribbella antibiotica]TDD57524.1 hypothetical protein E1263_23320 [Kribbella antibiotica]